MRILLVISSLAGGGAERVMAWLARELVEAGDDVCLLTASDSSSDFYALHPRVKRRVFKQRRFFNSSTASVPINKLRWHRAMRLAVKEEEIEVVLTFIDATNLSALFALAAARVPVIVSERTDPRFSQLSKFGRLIRPFLYRNLASKVIVQTNRIATQVEQEWRIERPVVIPNAVMIEPIREPAMERRTRVLSVGRLTPEKGHDILIRAWAIVAPKFAGWELRIVGEGPLRRELEQQVDTLGLNKSVSLPGMSREVASEYACASVFAFPSRVEGFPNALMEAMAAGCAPVAARGAGAVSDLIQNGENGLLVDQEDVAQLANALNSLLSDASTRQRYGRRAAAAAQMYDPKRIFTMWQSVLAECLSAPGGK